MAFCANSVEFDPPSTDVGDGPASFSPVESDVLALLVDGFTNAAIARQLNISERAVESHIRRVFDELHLDAWVRAILSSLPAERPILE